MARAEELARGLAEYDRDLALDFLKSICADLGGPEAEKDAEVAEMRGFLASPAAAQDALDKPTQEWKRDFGHRERARSLGLALANVLRHD